MSARELALFGGTPAIDASQRRHRWPTVGDDARARIERLLDAGTLSVSRREGIIEECENAFAQLTALKFIISTQSGSGALHAGYYGLDLPPGGEVIVPAYTHIGTALPMLHLGLLPVLCDVDDSNGLLDIGKVSDALTENTVAIAVTHVFGQPADTAALRKIAAPRGLKLLQDCSHAHGSSENGRHVGHDGDVACFSLQSHKAVPAGEGGILATDNETVAERAALLGHFREPREFTSEALRRFADTGWGLKNRLHPLAAALALGALRDLPELCEARAQNYNRLERNLRDVPGVSVFPTRENTTRGGFFRFPLHFKREELNGIALSDFLRALHAEGAVDVLPGSLARPLNSYAVFQEDVSQFVPALSLLASQNRKMRQYRVGDFPCAERLSGATIQLPAFGPGEEDLVDLYSEAIRKVCANSALLTQ